MDGIEDSKGIIVVACTSEKDAIDEALLRPGRLDHHFNIPLPGKEDLKAIIRGLLEKYRFDTSEDTINSLVSKFADMSPAQVKHRINRFAFDHLECKAITTLESL